MPRWIAVAPVLTLVLAGCLASVAPEDAPHPTMFPQPQRDASLPHPTSEPRNSSTAAQATPEGNTAEDGPPPGGPRSDEVWHDQWLCVDVETHWCDGNINHHTFAVGKLYGAMQVRFTVQEPAAVTINNDILITLTSPDGKQANGTRLSWEDSPYTAGTVVSFQVTNQHALAQTGTWRVSVWSTHLVASFVNYEARVSFTPHPEHPTAEHNGPGVVSFDTRLFVYTHVPVEWDRVAKILPDGFAPAGHPYVPLGDIYWGTPEDTAANVMIAVFPYERVSVDDVTLGPGRAALAWATVVPPSGYEHLFPSDALPGAPGFLWLGAVVTDPALAAALAGWQAPVSTGTIDLGLTGDPHAYAHATVTGDALDITLRVPQPTLSPADTGRAVELVNFVPRAGDVVQALHNRLDPHKALVGPSIVNGTIGPLDNVTTAGAYARTNWFDPDALTPNGTAALFTFTHAPLHP